MNTKQLPDEAPAELRLFQGEKWLAIVGGIGLVLGLIFVVLIAIRGTAVPPEGDLSKPFSFDAAIGLFLLTTAAILPLAGFRPVGRAVWRWVGIINALYAYGQESIQSLRGLDPRFTKVGTVTDKLFGAGFGLASLILITLYIILTVKMLLNRKGRPTLQLGVRYGLISALIGFASGVWIVTLQGRHFGPSGNIIWLHGLAFHGLQAVPLIAWLLEASNMQQSALAKRLIHLGGIAWLLFVLLVAGQTILGRSLLEVSGFTVGAIILFVAYLAVLVTAARTWRGRQAKQGNTQDA